MRSVTTFLVYGMREVGSEAIRFVGQSRIGLPVRADRYLQPVRRPAHYHHALYDWFEEIGCEQVEIVKLGSAGSADELDELEREITAELLRSGADLLNDRPGKANGRLLPSDPPDHHYFYVLPHFQPTGKRCRCRRCIEISTSSEQKEPT